MAWKHGPLPRNTWNWGGVVLADSPHGFHFADFLGDHARLIPSGLKVDGEAIMLWDNSLELPQFSLLWPIECKGRLSL